MHGDLTRTPLAYPLAAATGPRLVLDDCEHPIRPRHSAALGTARTTACPACAGLLGAVEGSRLEAVLAALGEVPLAQRTPVLAVGSNAATAVVRHKLGTRGVSTVVPVVTGVVARMDVGHSAHVSRGGYVPAAPLHRSTARTRVVLQLLDQAQLAAVDETEPNYERVEVSAARYPLVLSGGARPDRVHVYASRHGVLHLSGRGPARLLTQPEVLAALGDAGVPHTEGDPEEVARRLAQSPSVRRAVARALGELGMTRAAGLRHRPAGPLRWADVGQVASGPRSRPRLRPTRRRTGRRR
jgi:hypothetical protein